MFMEGFVINEMKSALFSSCLISWYKVGNLWSTVHHYTRHITAQDQRKLTIVVHHWHWIPSQLQQFSPITSWKKEKAGVLKTSTVNLCLSFIHTVCQHLPLIDASIGLRLAAWTLIITSLGDLTLATGISSEYFSTSLVPYWLMTHADIQLCSLEGELQTCLRENTLQPALANVLVELPAFVVNTHRSLVDAMARTEPIHTVEQLPASPRSTFKQICHLTEH